MEDKASECADRTIQGLKDHIALIWFRDVLINVFREGYWQANRDNKARLKELLSDINHSGFSMESIKMTLEEWVAP